jgi:hypothetical protein
MEKKTFKQVVSERLSSENIGDTWKKIRNVFGVVFIVSSLVGAAPISLPVGIATWIGYITLVSGVIAGRAQLDTSKKK